MSEDFESINNELSLLEKKKLLMEIKEGQQHQLDFMQRKKEIVGQGKRVRIIFLVTRPSVWGSYETVFQALIKDARFQVFIVTIPNKKQLPSIYFNHEEYIDEGAYDFFKDYPCRVINGFTPETKEWLDLKKMHPDYIFLQTPYNTCKPPQYHSHVLASYSRLIFCHYAMEMFKGEVLDSIFPPDFIRDMDLIFCQTKGYMEKLDQLKKSTSMYKKVKSVLSGQPRFDTLLTHSVNEESPLWKFPRSAGKLRIVWTPRWCVSENNSHFLEYKDKILELCDNNQHIDLIFRPHPQTFLEMVGWGHMTVQEVEMYKHEFTIRPNATLDTRGYYQDTFVSSDLLLTDISTIINEYLVIKKPIIYCHKTDWFTETTARLAKGFYWARSWDNVITYIEALQQKKDPLALVRSELVDDWLNHPPQGAGQFIKDYIINEIFD